MVSDTAKRQYDELQAEYLPGESDRGPERELIGEVGSSRQFRIYVDCYLHGLNSRVHRLPIEEAAAYVRKRNRVGKAVLKFAPSLWKRLFK
ncbi:hypothetical protein MACH17_09300 [Phaeobacter inhibens]|uniref:hypothetical protein n=1 Tax=Phaeobacter inhibens TaxID=221822 RepID=UPI00274FC02F|nr:hypothetical protein [Phaeobacter inhibens]GLO69413.1 hypothetical protein MACH17_09300 [Phaeobacter inhibens]